MLASSVMQIIIFLVVLLLLVKPLGWYMSRVYENKPCGLDRVLGPIERLLYRLCGINPIRRGVEIISGIRTVDLWRYPHYHHGILAKGFN